MNEEYIIILLVCVCVCVCAFVCARMCVHTHWLHMDVNKMKKVAVNHSISQPLPPASAVNLDVFTKPVIGWSVIEY